MSLTKLIKLTKNSNHNLQGLESIADNLNYDIEKIYKYHLSIGNKTTPLIPLPDLAKKIGVKTS